MNESRRNFLFGKNDNKKEELSQAPQQQDHYGVNAPTRTRRDILKKTAISAGLFVTADILSPETAEAGISTAKDILSPETAEAATTPEDEEFFKQFISVRKFISSQRRLHSSEKEFYSPDWLYTELSIAEADHVRKEFDKTFPDIPKLLEQAFNQKQTAASMLLQLKNMLEEVDAFGLWYAFLRKHGVYNTKNQRLEVHGTDLGLRIPTSDPSHYFVRAADFLPTADEITPEEIDPRLGQAKGLSRGIFDHETKKEILTTIEEDQGWTSNERQAKFKLFLDDEEVRKHFQTSDCTLAEVYSIIKAAIRYREEQSTTKMTNANIVKGLLLKRDAFKTKEILGPHTDRFTHFNYYEKSYPKRFDGDTLDDIGEATMHLEHEIEKDNNDFRRRITRIEGDDPAYRRKIFEAIALPDARSTQQEVVYFNTHGYPDGFSVSSETDETISMSHIADVLMVRLYNQKDPKTWGKITFIFDACYSHDMVKKRLEYYLRAAFKKASEVTDEDIEKKNIQYAQYFGVLNFNDLDLPTIITASQEGSLGFQGELKGPIHKSLKSIRKEGGLTGEFLMRRVQPASYPMADIAIFYGQKEGKFLEIGMTENKQLDKREV